MYAKLKNVIQRCCAKMPAVIMSYVKREPDKEKSALYNLFFENFKNIESLLINIDIKAYSQAGAVLRNALEQVAVLKLLNKKPELVSEYIKFSNLRLGMLREDAGVKQQANELFQKRKSEKCSFTYYLDFGWLEKLGETDVSIYRIMKLAGLEDFVEWKKFCNNFVHNTLSIIFYDQAGIQHNVESFIYISGILFDILMTDFHKLTGFEFCMDDVNYARAFKELFDVATVQMRAKKKM